MKKYCLMHYDYKYELFALIITILSMGVFKHVFGTNLAVYLMYICSFFFILFSASSIIRDLNKISILYCFGIALGYFFHKMVGVKDVHFIELIIRIIPVLIIIHYRTKRNYNNQLIKDFAILFFIIECVIAIYEKVTLTHFIDFSSKTSQAMNATMDTNINFRSFSLLGHPLLNANIVSVFLAFILCSKDMQIKMKLLLIGLGSGALWAFNSRAALLIWFAILFYRFFYYKSKNNRLIVALVVFLLFVFNLDVILLYVQKTGLLGRLNFDFSDGSSLSRLYAIDIFLSHSWSMREIFMGGTILYQPLENRYLRDVPIENGILLDLGYWGFILGPIKILGELIISYMALHRFPFKDKIIIMISLWGVAFMNNNSFYTFLMPFYTCALLSFGTNQYMANLLDRKN